MSLPEADDTAALWRIAWPDAIATRSWGTDMVVHDAVTRNVHFLDAFSAAVLDLLQDGPADVVSLARDLQTRFELDAPDLPADVERVCIWLGRLDLIERSRR